MQISNNYATVAAAVAALPSLLPREKMKRLLVLDAAATAIIVIMTESYCYKFVTKAVVAEQVSH